MTKEGMLDSIGENIRLKRNFENGCYCEDDITIGKLNALLLFESSFDDPNLEILKFCNDNLARLEPERVVPDMDTLVEIKVNTRLYEKKMEVRRKMTRVAAAFMGVIILFTGIEAYAVHAHDISFFSMIINVVGDKLSSSRTTDNTKDMDNGDFSLKVLPNGYVEENCHFDLTEYGKIFEYLYQCENEPDIRLKVEVYNDINRNINTEIDKNSSDSFTYNGIIYHTASNYTYSVIVWSDQNNLFRLYGEKIDIDFLKNIVKENN